MPDMTLSFEVPEIKIQTTSIEYVAGTIKGIAERTNTAHWRSHSPTKNWDPETFDTLEAACDYTVQMIKQAAMKKAAVAALNEQLEIGF